jgi:hypothetical protein
LESYIDAVEEEIDNILSKPNLTRDNLNKEERSALHTLKNRVDIVIKKADKASTVVVMDRDKYLTEAHRQLSDDSFYKKLQSDPTEEFNNFMFNDEHYLQISGTAMGTKMAPSYANIFLGRLERRLLHYAPTKPFSWLRFIDDINMKWVDGRDSLNDSIEMTNSFHYSIKFTLEISTSKNIFGYHSNTEGWGN